MIDDTISYLAKRLNSALQTRFGRDTSYVHMPAPKGASGAGGQTADGVTLTLVNLEREGVARNSADTTVPRGAGFRTTLQPLNLNLVILVSAHDARSYAVSLELLSATIAHFQAQPVRTTQTDPLLPKGLDRLAIEWRDMDLAAMHNLWTALGQDYRPSAVYVARMVVVSDDTLGQPVAPITKIGLDDD